MQRIRTAVFLSLTLSAVIPVSGQYGERIDLLANGGFEDGVTEWAPDVQHSLVTNARIAHGGQACLTGEVVKADQALRLRRSRAGARGKSVRILDLGQGNEQDQTCAVGGAAGK